MSIPRPDPGNLIATVDQLVDAVNAGGGGGGGTDLTNYVGDSVSIETTGGGLTNFTANNNGIGLVTSTGLDIEMAADGGTVAMQVTTNGIDILSDTDSTPSYRIKPDDAFYFGNGSDDVENGPSLFRGGSNYITAGGGVGADRGLQVGLDLHVAGGDVVVEDIGHGIRLISPDGTVYLVTVANGGTLSVTPV